jgi:hypothetical protein
MRLLRRCAAKLFIKQNQALKRNMNSREPNLHGAARSQLQPTNKKAEIMNSISKTSPISPGATWGRGRLSHLLAPLFLLTLACFIFPLGSLAQSDDFNTGNDNGWTRHDPLVPFGGGATFSFPSGGYRIQVPSSPNVNTLGPARAAALHTDVTYTNFAVSADLIGWDENLGQAFGVLARIRNLGRGTANGYAFFYFPGSHVANINRIDNELGIRIGNANVAVNLDPSKDYRFVFSGSGSSLNARIYDLADLTTPLANTFATDATYKSGSSGVVVSAASATPGSAADATFDNYSAWDVTMPPQLRIERGAVLKWLVTGIDYVVESAAKIEGPWSSIGLTPTVIGNEASVLVEAPGAAKFFRLSRP